MSCCGYLHPCSPPAELHARLPRHLPGSCSPPHPTLACALQYVLLLWLSMLVLIPFDIAIVDSSLAAAAAAPAAEAEEEPAAVGNGSAGAPGSDTVGDDALAPIALPPGVPPIVGTILAVCQRHLASPGSTREMAAVVVGRLLTRPDMAPALAAFLPWGCAALGSRDSQRASFLVPGEAGQGGQGGCGEEQALCAGHATCTLCGQPPTGRALKRLLWLVKPAGMQAGRLRAASRVSADGLCRVAAALPACRHGSGICHLVQAGAAVGPAVAGGTGLSPC